MQPRSNAFLLLLQYLCYTRKLVLTSTNPVLARLFTLVGCSFETVNQSLSGRLPERGRTRREKNEESKNVQTTPTRTYCKRNTPLSYYRPNCRTPGIGSLPRTIAPQGHLHGFSHDNNKWLCCFSNAKFVAILRH